MRYLYRPNACRPIAYRPNAERPRTDGRSERTRPYSYSLRRAGGARLAALSFRAAALSLCGADDPCGVDGGVLRRYCGPRSAPLGLAGDIAAAALCRPGAAMALRHLRHRDGQRYRAVLL